MGFVDCFEEQYNQSPQAKRVEHVQNIGKLDYQLFGSAFMQLAKTTQKRRSLICFYFS